MACFDTFLRDQRITSITGKTNRFLASPPFIIAVILLTAVANFFSLELLVYSVFALLTVYICVFGNDLLPLMPICICCYLTPSSRNNPGRNEASVFSGAGGIYIACLAVVMAVFLIMRIVKDRQAFFTAKRPLLTGMLVLQGAYLLSGIGSAAYPQAAPRNILFALLQGASIILPYWLFSGGVVWKHVRRDYFAWIGFSVGGLLLCQTLWVYCTNSVVINGVINRDLIYTGWGMHNNLGGMLAMMIPYTFYLATKYRRGWIGTVVGSLYLICLLLTCSRSAILTGTGSYLLCVFLMLHYARNRRHNTIALAAVTIAALLSVVLFRSQLLRLFSALLEKGMDPSSRDEIYAEGLALFARSPIFGNSFYSPGYLPWDWSTVEQFSRFFPPRWHNTIVQLLASCGVAGLGAYLLHRVQTVKLFLRSFDKEKAFIGCSLLVLLGCSLFDCHFFNIGPVLFYSMALSFAENCPGFDRLPPS